MHKVLVIILLLIFGSSLVGEAQSPSITYVSSFYKTTAGAIGPSGIIATTTYDLKINSHKTIILDDAVISGLRIMGDGILIPTSKEGTIEFQIRVFHHQKDTVWYNGELKFQGISVPTKTYEASESYQNKEYPAVVLFLRSGGSKHTVVKERFDQEHSQYNK
ncbi:MAG: hypothetical protein ACR2MX_12040 [Cyclobacteriaceae bacterium]